MQLFNLRSRLRVGKTNVHEFDCSNTNLLASELLSKASDTALKSLQAQYETSTKVADLAKSVSTMSKIAENASNVCIQLEQILSLIGDLEERDVKMLNLVSDVKDLSTKAQGMF